MAFNVAAFLASPGRAKTIQKYGRNETIFRQGDACEEVLYIQTGGVSLSMPSKTGGESVIATLGPGEFFGEGSLAGQPVRTGGATAITPTAILLVRKDRMARLIHNQPAMSGRFIAHLLSRSARIEEDLIGQVVNPGRKRRMAAKARRKRRA
jgi:CRP/FNR family cyclic AMP-dependent transcriptional regulator